MDNVTCVKSVKLNDLGGLFQNFWVKCYNENQNMDEYLY